MTDRDDLLRDILTYPGADLPRLKFADWLDEHAGTEACQSCHAGEVAEYEPGIVDPRRPKDCARCGGSGRVPDPAAARAEFIRVQCALGATDPAVLETVDTSSPPDRWDTPSHTWGSPECGAAAALRRRMRWTTGGRSRASLGTRRACRNR